MMRKRPNIVLTIADDHRGTALGCGGIEPVLTPSLDALAARGTRFVNAQHLGSCHGAVCAPSRAMLHTGFPYFQLDPGLLGPADPPPDRPVNIPPTLGQKLQEAGYESFATGKWHNGVRSFHRSFNRGASIFFGGMNDHWFTPVQDFDPSGQYPNSAKYLADGFSTEVFARSAIDFIRSRRDDERPFFCYCAFTAPHDPRTPPDHWRRQYRPSSLTMPPNVTPSFFGHSPLSVMPSRDMGTTRDRDELLLGTPRDVREIERALAGYYGMISHMDEWIGKIHEAVEEIGVAEGTIVIHTSDHGLAVGQHGFLGKENLYQHSLNVPLILAGPDIPGGLVSEALCYQHDLHPTLAERAGAAPPDGKTFRNLDAVISGDGGRTYIGSSYMGSVRSIRDKRYKLIEYHVQDEKSCELFDLQSDPWETCNLEGQSEQRDTLVRLRRELAAWRDEVKDGDWKAE